MASRAGWLILLGAMMAAAAHAQPWRYPIGVPKPVERTVKAWEDVRISDLLGKQVTNREDEDLGRIEEVILDSGTGRVHYAVVSFGGWLELGDKHFLYPVYRLSPGRNRDRVVLDVERDKLAATPGFESDRWPDLTDRLYWENARRALGEHDQDAAKVIRRFVRASELLDKEIVDRAGDEVGELEDVVINLGTGRVRYAVVEFDREWNPDDKLVALPLRALSFPADPDDDVVLNVDPGRLDRSLGFERDAWPLASAGKRHAAAPLEDRGEQFGCWAMLFDEPNFGEPQAQITSSTYIEEFETGVFSNPELAAVGGEAFLKEVDSVIVGPRARLLGYERPRFLEASLTIGPGRRVADLSRLGYHKRVRSLILQCE